MPRLHLTHGSHCKRKAAADRDIGLRMQFYEKLQNGGVAFHWAGAVSML